MSNNGTLTEFERVKMENYALRHAALTQQLQTNLQERIAFIRQIEDAHPGHHWSEESGLRSNELTEA